MWISEVGPILVGLAGVLTALRGLLAYGGQIPSSTRSAPQEDLSECLEEMADLQDQHQSALRHIYRLERFIAGYGLHAPERPESIYR